MRWKQVLLAIVLEVLEHGSEYVLVILLILIVTGIVVVSQYFFK